MIFSKFLIKTALVTSFLLLVYSNALFAQNTGWLKLSFNIDYLYVIVEGDRVQSFYVQPGDSIKIPTGTHSIRMLSEIMDDVRAEVEISKDKTFFRSYNFTKFSRSYTLDSFSEKPTSSIITAKSGYNIVIGTDPGGMIYLNDEQIGSESARLYLPPKKHTVRIVHPELGTSVFKIKPSLRSNSVYHRLNKNPYELSTLSHFIPAHTFLKRSENKKALISLAGYGIGGALFFINTYNYQKTKSDFNDKSKSYHMATNIYDAYELGDQIFRLQQEMNSLNKNYRSILLGLGTWYALNTIWTFKKPRAGYKGPELTVQTASPFPNQTSLSLMMNLNF